MYSVVSAYLDHQTRTVPAALFADFIGASDAAVLPDATEDEGAAIFFVTVEDVDFEADTVLVSVEGGEPLVLHAHTLAVAVYDA